MDKKRRQQASDLWTGFKDKLSFFVQTVFLMFLWALLPFGVYLLTTFNEAKLPARQLEAASFKHHTQRLSGSGQETLTLEIAYPATLYLNNPGEANRPLSIWLSSPLTSTAAASYTVSFAPNEHLTFVDKADSPIPPLVILTTESDASTPTVIYIRPNLNPNRSLPATAILTGQISGAARIIEPLPSLSIGLESVDQARNRHLFRLFWGGATAQLISLGIAMVGFGVSQWQQMSEHRRKKEESERNQALKDIDEMGGLLEANDLAKGTERYLTYHHRREKTWADERIQQRLAEEWQEKAPPHLQRAISWFQTPSTDRKDLSQIDTEQKQSFTWSYYRLGENLQNWSEAGLLTTISFPDDIYPILQRRSLAAMMGLWDHLTLHLPPPSSQKTYIEAGQQRLGLEVNPFGAGRAEEDTLLLESHFEQPLLEEIRTSRATLICGASGSGKTAMALALLQEYLNKEAFPVYWPLSASELATLQLEDIAPILARTLLAYIAVSPTGFLRHEIGERATIAHLIGRYIGTGPALTLKFCQAGLPRLGIGEQTLTEINRLLQDVSFEDAFLNRNELLNLLARARPYGFSQTMLLMDVQPDEIEQRPSEPDRDLSQLITGLEKRGVFMKIFMPSEIFEPEEWPIDPVELSWTEADLQGLLINRLRYAGDDSLALWCVAGQAGTADLDTRLLQQARGSPARLIALGNALLARIGQTGEKLSRKEVDRLFEENNE